MNESAQVESSTVDATAVGTPNETVLVLRTCKADLRSYNNFLWPESGPVSAPDWQPTQECGKGLHGLLWGEGDAGYLNWEDDAKWLVVEVEKATVIDIDGKIKFPRGVVVYCGDRYGATAYIYEHGAAGRAVVGGTATAGYSGTATAGYSGTATAGDSGTATAGYSGTATAGDSGTATAGDSGTATAGYRGTATAGYRGTATAGDRGTATAGDRGTATAGDRGTATAGYSGTATAGYSGTATAGYRGTATAGEDGTLIIRWWDHEKDRWRSAIGYVGEDGILPNVPYRLDDNHTFVQVQPLVTNSITVAIEEPS